MKESHREILNKIEEYLEQDGSEHLRFWQALRNMNLIEYQDTYTGKHLEVQVVDDYDISDKALLKRIINQ